MFSRRKGWITLVPHCDGLLLCFSACLRRGSKAYSKEAGGEMGWQQSACLKTLSMPRRHEFSKGWEDTTEGSLAPSLFVLTRKGCFLGVGTSAAKAVTLTTGGRCWSNDERG